MNVFEILSILNVTSNNGLKYRGIAFDGCYFYLTETGCHRIYKYDKCFKLIEYVQTCRAYTAICYDMKQKCFWSSSEKCPDKVFKLDRDLKEIDYITVPGYEEKWGYIESISCNCCSNRLLIAYCSCIIELDKGCCPRMCILQEACNKCYLSVLYLYTCYVVVYVKNCQKFLSIYTFDNKLIDRFCLPEECHIENMTFYAYLDEQREKYQIYLLDSSQRGYYVLKCKVLTDRYYKRCTPCNHCKDDTCCYSKYYNPFKDKREDRCHDKCEDRCHDKCEDRCHDKCEDRCDDKCEDRCHDQCEDRCHDQCEDRCHDKCEDRCHDQCEDRCHDKCEDRCHDKCEERCHDQCEERCHDKCEDRCHDKCEDRCHDKCEDRCHDKCEDRCHDKCEDRCHDRCEDSCDDIIESIALVEAALAHILNAEGEKIQKVVRCSNSINDILETNRLVNKTITHIVHLEQVLYSKLDLVIDKDCECFEPCCYDHHIDTCLRQLKNG